MAKIGFNFDGTVEDLTKNDFDRTPLPDGEYLATIQDADYRDNATGTGSYVMTEFEIIDGQHSGRKVWSNYNVQHQNTQAQDIGQQQFAKLCLATLGKPSCADTDELIGRQVVIGVARDKKDETRNRVKYANSADKPLAPVAQAAAVQSTQTVSAASSVAKSTKPWQK